jgi:protein involved in polysaccharide export with SLBB domain
MKQVWGLVLLAALGAMPLAAQDGNADKNVVNRPLATREELQAALQRAGASQVAVQIKSRLDDGDFRRGDRIALEVQGEQALTDTFVVGSDAQLMLPAPTVGAMSLKGVLRSELQKKMEEYVGRFRNNPVVRAQPLLRLSVQGEVAKAGIYAVPADGQLADALMAAGGTTQYAKPNQVTIERNGKAFWKGSAFDTDLDVLGLKDGDQIVVGSNRPGDGLNNLRTVGLLVSMAVGLYTLSRAIHH